MSIQTLDDDLNIIQKLDDEPNDVGGLTADELKARFDAAGLAIQTYINQRLIPDLKAANLPFEQNAAVPAATVQAAIENVQSQIAEVVIGKIPDGSITPEKLTGAARRFYRRFSAGEWQGGQITIQPAEHQLDATLPMCIHKLHMLVGKTAEDYTDATIAQARTQFIAALKAAKAANDSAPGTYPTASDGHIILTWYQIQYYLLTGNLVNSATAQSQASEMGYDWQGVVTTPPQGTVHTLDELLAAGYTPMLGGSSVAFDSLFTLDTALGLGFRRKMDTQQQGAAHTYDLFGKMVANTWGCIDTEVTLDPQTKILRLTSDTPYDGELLVLG